tara:strand:- start:2968 stop:3396 length:429 start_codon:yes stop_codon:yes gene_type:complete
LTTPSKRKGDNYERELAAYINDKVGTKSFRAPLSGGGNVGMSGGADLLGVPELFVEAKRVERLNFHDALRQAERNAEKTGSSETPIVINRKNRQPTGDSLCLVRLDEFLKFYKAYLVLEGQIDTESDRGASVQRVQTGATIK